MQSDATVSRELGCAGPDLAGLTTMVVLQTQDTEATAHKRNKCRFCCLLGRHAVQRVETKLTIFTGSKYPEYVFMVIFKDED